MSLKMSKCKLKQVPKLDQFVNLLHLDIAENDMHEIDDSIPLPKLNSFQIQQNPLEVIDISMDTLPGLTELTCGSTGNENHLDFLFWKECLREV